VGRDVSLPDQVPNRACLFSQPFRFALVTKGENLPLRSQVVECLSQVIESNTECINAVLDALSSFSLHPEMALLCDITDLIVQRLDSAAPGRMAMCDPWSLSRDT